MRQQPQRGPMNASELLQRAAAAMALPALGTIWEDLVSALGRALRVDWVLLGELPSGQDIVVQTLAVWHRGKIVPNFKYHYERIPEDDVLSHDLCLYPGAAQSRLPNAWLKQVRAQVFGRASLLDSLGRTRGILAIAHGRPLEHANLIEAALRVFAFKAAAELDRGLADEHLFLEFRETVQRSRPR
jgi:hypothetical protein